MKNIRSKLKGTGVAIVSPFKRSGSVDFVAYEKVMNHIIEGGCEFIVVLGTTGESPTLSKQEKTDLIKFSVEKNAGRVPLVIGIGGNNTAEVIITIDSTSFKGVDAVLSVCPYYNKPQQEGIFRHFKAVSEASPVPVILYTVPGRTGSNITASTTLRLAKECKNIIGIKEASGNIDQISQVLKNRPKDFLVFSGDDALTLSLLALGTDGVISVVANVFPKEFSNMVRFGLKGDFGKARVLHFRLLDFINSIFADGSPAGVKAALELKKLAGNFLRLPLVPVNNATYKLIHQLINL
ncbi:MAG: 4-hydroxy-tetrahydrodipicolinate synthase [Bacteroidetes bacterium]|nr:4-hydroxy-tetrahydrodipicolinate synthase [Bacteroidota bacterium]